MSEYEQLKSERNRLKGILTKGSNVKGSPNYKLVEKKLEETKRQIKDKFREQYNG